MQLQEAAGDWALVTGASSGIGKEFALRLAKSGLNVVLTARREIKLNQVAEEIQKQEGVRTLVVSLDLTETNAVEILKEKIEAEGIKIRVLCNNAAFGQWGRFVGCETERYEKMIHLNMNVPVTMCREFYDHLIQFPRSLVINVSSAAAYQPVPFMAVYAATKSFLSAFSQALYEEWKDKGVLVQTLIPGPTDTEFDKTAGAYNSQLGDKRDSPEYVVTKSLEKLSAEKPVATAAGGTFGQRIFAAVFPPKMVVKTVGNMFRPEES